MINILDDSNKLYYKKIFKCFSKGPNCSLTHHSGVLPVQRPSENTWSILIERKVATVWEFELLISIVTITAVLLTPKYW